MNCLKASELISKAKETPLDFDEKIKLKLHLIACKHCRNFQNNCHTLSQMMKTFAGKQSDIR